MPQPYFQSNDIAQSLLKAIPKSEASAPRVADLEKQFFIKSPMPQPSFQSNDIAQSLLKAIPKSEASASWMARPICMDA